MSASAWFALSIMVAICIPVVVGLLISGPPGFRRAQRDAGRFMLRAVGFALVLVAACAAIGAAIFAVVRLVRLAWSGT